MRISLSKKTLTLVTATLVTIGVGIFVYNYFTHSDQPTNITERPIGSKDTIEYVPATEEEKDFSDSKKDELIAEQKKAAEEAAQGSRKNIPPIITNATQSATTRGVTITAYMPGIAEENGTCTLVLSRGSQKVTKTVAGFANVANTNCEAFIVAQNEVSDKGSWTAVVSYNSANTAGVSQPKKIEIQ